MQSSTMDDAAIKNRKRRNRVAFAAPIAIVASFLATVAFAQSTFQFPWEEPEVRPEPRQQVPRQQGGGWSTETQPQNNAPGGWTARSNICLRLEQQLVAQSGQGEQTRNLLPQIENDIRRVNRNWQKAENELERRNCFEYFFFSKSIRRTRRCINLANQSEAARRRIAQLQAQKQQIQSASNSSYQDEIIRELARNNCGTQYVREARRRDRNPFSDFWGYDDGGSGYANDYNALPFATYRTLCVRLCDGYYFPVSFSTLPNHFQRDADVCQSKCAAPAKLYYHQNPGGAIEDMVDAQTNEPYKGLKEAFLYRKKYVKGCSCKAAEYQPNQTPIPLDGIDGEDLPPPAQQGAAPSPEEAGKQAAARNEIAPPAPFDPIR